MRYSADVQTEDGKVTPYWYENSYDVGSYPALCGLTAIFLGGACWFYTVMPTTGQKNAVRRDAEDALEQKLQGRRFEIHSAKVSQEGWGGIEPVASFQP